MVKGVLVVRIKGQADCPYWATTTMKLLNLEKKYRATIVPSKDTTMGMLDKVKHYVSWHEVDVTMVKELLEKKARKSGYKKVNSEDIAAIGYKTIDELATSLVEGKIALSKLSPLKPWFALAPPRHGFKRSTKKLYGQKGVLGKNKDLSTIVRNMI